MKTPAAGRDAVLRKLAAQPASALFAGPRGAGKTKAVQAIAAETGATVQRVDLGAVVSRYIGETEKALDRLFADAAGKNVVLVFDEADALFGKRGEVGDAHDRYANAAAEYLLAKLEAHSGLAIVTTRDRDALDPAFVRRLRHVVAFPAADGRGDDD